MKYLELKIKAESCDTIANLLILLTPVMDNLGLDYETYYKDSVVEEQVKRMLAEHLSDNKFIEHDN